MSSTAPGSLRSTDAAQCSGGKEVWRVTDEAHRSTNLVLLERFGARQDGSRLSTAQVTEALDRARAEREAHLSEAVSDAP